MSEVAEILVECGYALKTPRKGVIQLTEGAFAKEEYVNPFFDDIEGRRQLDALFWYFINGREQCCLTGLGHSDHREQMIKFVKEKL